MVNSFNFVMTIQFSSCDFMPKFFHWYTKKPRKSPSSCRNGLRGPSNGANYPEADLMEESAPMTDHKLIREAINKVISFIARGPIRLKNSTAI